MGLKIKRRKRRDGSDESLFTAGSSPSTPFPRLSVSDNGITCNLIGQRAFFRVPSLIPSIFSIILIQFYVYVYTFWISRPRTYCSFTST